MSFSVIPPTARCTNVSSTSGRSSLRRLSVTASSEPCTSALRIRLSVAVSPDWIWLKMSSSLVPVLTRASPRWDLQPQAVLAGLADGAGHLLVGRDAELVAGLGHRRQAEHLHRRRRPGALDLLALVVEHRPHPAPRRTGDDRVADLQLALVDEHRGHGAAAGVEVGLEHDALGPTVGVGGELLELGDDQQLVEQVVDAEVLGGRHLDDDRVAAPRLGHEFVLGELREHPLRIGVVLVDLVDRHDDRHLGGAGVVDRLDRLGHHAVVGGDHQHHDVGGLGATGTHLRERGVARRVEERDCRPRCSTW